MSFKPVECCECGCFLLADMDDCVWNEKTERFYCTDCWDKLQEEADATDREGR